MLSNIFRGSQRAICSLPVGNVKFLGLRLVGRASLATGSHGHEKNHDSHHEHDDHKPQGPYDFKHHHTNHEEAYFLGINPKEYKWEGFEIVGGITLIIFFGIVFAAASRPDANELQDWARAEARVRRERIKNGQPVEYGTFYSTPNYEQDEDFKTKIKEADE